MAELLLVSNPHKRKGKKMAKRARKRRQPAALRKYWAARRGKKKHHKRRTRVHHRRRARVHRRRRHAVAVAAPRRRRRSNPHRRHRARYRRRHRNPSLRNIGSQIMPTVKAGAWGAAGALGLDVLWGLVVGNLPSLATYIANPYVGFAAKAVGAVGVGALGGHIAKGKGRELAVGAMTVVTHDFLKSMLQQMAPTIFGTGGSLPLGAYLSGEGSPANLGAYLSGAAPIVGTATVPQAYLPFAGSSGSSGTADGIYAEDHMGMDPWGL